MTNTTLINKENKIKNSFYKRIELIDTKDITAITASKAIVAINSIKVKPLLFITSHPY